MHIEAYGLTDQGQARHDNQDAYLIDMDHHFFAVADGIGGLPGGADASRRIMELLDENIRRASNIEKTFELGNLIIGINRIISRESNEAYPATGSGSTLTLCQIIEDQLLIGHVGDSAAYLWRNSDLKKLTIDHTMEQELINQYGEEARQHMPPEYPNTLTRCVGQEGELLVDQTRLELKPDDRVLLCTDGFNKVVSEAETIQTLGSNLSAEAICKELTAKANAESGPDNITVITLILS